MNDVISVINSAISRINSIHIDIPKWVPGVGGKTFAPTIANIPTLAKGTQNWKGGLVQISERGGEIWIFRKVPGYIPMTNLYRKRIKMEPEAEKRNDTGQYINTKACRSDHRKRRRRH